MSHRLVALLFVLVPTVVSASPEFDLSAGGGASVVVSDPCGGPYSAADCTTPRTRLVGPTAMVRASVGKHHALRRGWGLRWGGAVSGMFMKDSGDSGTIISAGGQFGATWDRLFATSFAGLSFVRVRNDAMVERGATFAFGGDAGIEITPQLSAFVRVDLDAIMHGPVAGAFIGAGLSVRP